MFYIKLQNYIFSNTTTIFFFEKNTRMLFDYLVACNFVFVTFKKRRDVARNVST